MIYKVIKYILKKLENIQNEKYQKNIKKVNLLFAFFCLIFIVSFYTENQSEVNFNSKTLHYELIFMIFIYLLSSKVWTDYMEANYKGSKKDYFNNWSFSKLGRYIPAGIMVLSVRLNHDLPKDKSSNKILFGLIEEQFLGPLLCLPALCLSIYFGVGPTILYGYICFQVITFFIFRFIYLKFNKGAVSLLNFPIYYLASLLLNVVLFTFIAINLDLNNPYQLGILYSISASIGLLFPGVPAGIGIRETFFFLLSNEAGTNIEIIELMLQVRIVAIIVDLIFGLWGIIQIYLVKRNNG